MAASMTAAAMFAFQVGAKATRDALFLSSFGARALPSMMIASAIVSIALAYVATRAHLRWGPARLIPAAFAGSALLLMFEWGLSARFRGVAAVLVYLHCGALGALLISGFWSYVSERFDPRTARKRLGRIAAGGSLGGLIGGVVAVQVGGRLPVTAMLPILAAFHAVCAAFAVQLRPAAGEAKAPPRSDQPERADARQLLGAPYIKGLVALGVLATVGEGLIDLVLKGRASMTLGTDSELLQFFAVFYTGISLLTLVAQTTLSRFALERLGPARAAGTLPAGAAMAAIGAIAWPGLVSAAVARCVESVLRNSVFQTGYEVLFTPIPAREKRAVKSLVDVGGVRIGDMVAAGLAQAVIALSLPSPGVALLALSAGASVTSLAVAMALHSGYSRTLRRALISRAVQLDLAEAHDSITRSTILNSVVALRVPLSGLDESGATGVSQTIPGLGGPSGSTDPDEPRSRDLRSRDARRVIRALRDGPLHPALALQAIPLLAWDDVAQEAIEALRTAGPETMAPLVARLLDPDEEFTIRRRVPLVLGTYPDPRAVEALVEGLADRRFEVRYRCGRALSHVLGLEPALRVRPERVYEAISREARVGSTVWRGRQVLDDAGDATWSPVLDEAIRTRASRSLEHVFTLLALVLPRQPLRIAFRGLLTDDPLLRGTALEYLESVLPTEIRRQLWPYLEDDRPRRPASVPPADTALANLLRSSDSIAVSLESPRRTPPDGGGATPKA